MEFIYQETEAKKALVGLLYRKTAYGLGTGRIHNRTRGRRQCLELPLHQSHRQNKPLLHLGRKESGKKNGSLVPKSSEKAYFCGRWRNLPPLASPIVNNFWASYGFPGGSDSKASACNARDPGSIPGLGRSSGEENVSPPQYSCLENPMDRGA